MYTSYFSYDAAGNVINTVIVLLALLHGQHITHSPFLFRAMFVLYIISAVTAIARWALQQQNPYPLQRLYREILSVITRYTAVLGLICTNRWLGLFLEQTVWDYTFPLRFVPLILIVSDIKEAYIDLFYREPEQAKAK